ncbi:hypothetical protein GEMRC1_003673 [Eukaryota sp. GEM-RC1]
MSTPKFWLSAWDDPLASVQAYSPQIALSDAGTSGEGVLLLSDLAQRLLIYKGTSLLGENSLPQVPCALVSFRMFQSSSPCVAVATGSSVFVYKIVLGSSPFRPYACWKLPPLETDSREVSVWQSMIRGDVSIEKSVKSLAELRSLGVDLTSESMSLLSLSHVSAQTAYVKGLMAKSKSDLPFQSRRTVITALTCLPKQSSPDSEELLVVATEDERLFILNKTVTGVVESFSIGEIATRISVFGCHDAEFRLVIASRDGKLIFVKNSKVLSNIKNFDQTLSDVCISNQSVFCSTCNVHSSKLYSYSLKGKRQFCLTIPAVATCIEGVYIPTAKTGPFIGCLVSCSNGFLYLYDDNGSLVSSSEVSGVVTGMSFGLYGREPNTLVLVKKSGGISILILNRLASLKSQSNTIKHVEEQDTEIDLPQKTKCFFDFADRERSCYDDVFKVFQRDLLKLRHATVKKFVGALASSGSQGCRHLRLNCSISGLGPRYSVNGFIDNVAFNGSSLIYVNLIVPKGLVCHNPVYKVSLPSQVSRPFHFTIVSDTRVDGFELGSYGDVRVEVVCSKRGGGSGECAFCTNDGRCLG